MKSIDESRIHSIQSETISQEGSIVQSPFLPGTKVEFAWDSTALGAIKLCPRYYYYTIICGYVPKDEPTHLRFGIEYHSAIQDYENLRAARVPFNDAVRETMGNLLVRSHDFDPDPTTKAGQYKNPNTLRQLVVDYLDEFRSDPCETLILANGKPAVELSFRWELDWGPGMEGLGEGERQGMQPYLLCGHLDRVVKYNSDLFVLDHKTTQTAPTDYYFAGFSPNNQVTLYSLAGQIVLDSPMRGVIIEAAQILLETPNRFVRRPMYTSDQLIHEWLDDLVPVLEKAEDYARAEYWPKNDTACGMYGGCKFRGVCSKNPEVRKHYLAADFIQLKEQDRWNPLKAR